MKTFNLKNFIKKFLIYFKLKILSNIFNSIIVLNGYYVIFFSDITNKNTNYKNNYNKNSYT